MEQNIGRYRWTICSLVFFATTINYLDRAVISLLKSTLTTELKWDDGDYTNVEIAFKVSYAIGLLLAGRFIDTVGTKKGYAWATGLWSVAAVLHAAAKSVFGFSVARAALGVTEAGNFPAAIKTVAEWFPRKERALATGLFNSGANIGAIVAPLTVPFIAAAYGWQWAFIATGLLGFIWLIFWNKHYYKPSEHPKLSAAELAYINSDADAIAEGDALQSKPFGWASLLKYKQTWAFAIGKLLTDPIWWFYLFWLPDFLESQYHIKGTAIALPVAAVLLTTEDNKAYENVVDATAVTVKTPLNVLSTPPTLTLLPTVSPWVPIVNVATVPDAALFVTTYVRSASFLTSLLT